MYQTKAESLKRSQMFKSFICDNQMFSICSISQCVLKMKETNETLNLDRKFNNQKQFNGESNRYLSDKSGVTKM